jgi:signal transduction histidine kinase
LRRRLASPAFLSEEVLVPKKNNEIRKAFRPRARLLQLLGDQLIGSPKLAVFELVKNAYDADASFVRVRLENLTKREPRIVVEDDGQGMSLATIQNVWLVPGDDHRERQRLAEKRSPRFKRLPLGEKGVGRFAVHKLGDRIQLVTRATRRQECVVDIDWGRLMERRFLEDAEVTVTEREPEHFKGGKTGTLISITKLREKEWTRRDVRDLYRQLTSIASPFEDYEGELEIQLEVPDSPWWISNLPDPKQLVERAPWKFEFSFDGKTFWYRYSFRGVPGIKVSPRDAERSDVPLQIVRNLEPDDFDSEKAQTRRKTTVKLVADETNLAGIGEIHGQFYIFDRDREVLSKLGESRFLERFLDQNGGIRIYRDGIRVYNYGEPGDDWLGLDLRRVNAPTRNISRNIILGALNLDLKKSRGLREKTNREGFVENEAYQRLRELVLGVLATLETERRIDKQKIRIATGGTTQPSRDLKGPVEAIRRVAAKHRIAAEIEPSLKKIEADYRELRDNFLRAGLSQVGLAIVFHEVERGVAVLHRAIEQGTPMPDLQQQAGQLQRILETSTQLLRKDDKTDYSLKHLVKRARDLSSIRFRLHRVKLTCPALEESAPDASAVFAFSLALGALTNLIDNAVHWLKIAHAEDARGGQRRELFIDILPDYPGGPAIVVADNGTGFLDEPEVAVEPFFGRRPDGMGLGLYYANLVMQLNDGQLAFPSREDVDVPDEFDGAIVAMVFKRS